MHTVVVTISNIFIPSAHSVVESPSQVRGQMCGSCELVKPTIGSNTDGCLLHGTINKSVYL